MVCANCRVRAIQQGLHVAGTSHPVVKTPLVSDSCAQYFLWYLPLLPLLIPRLSVSPTRATCLLLVWVGTQALWLSEAYKLEFLGADVFFGLWVRSLIYVAGGAWVLGGIMHGYARGAEEEC